MPRLISWRALAIGASLLAAAPVGGLAATPRPQPAPSASPTPAPSCTVPPGLEGDPQEQALAAQCKAEQAKIQTEKGKLTDSITLAQGTSDSLQQMLKQSRDAVIANLKLQGQTQAEIAALGVREAETSHQVEATKKRLGLRRGEFSAFLRRNYKYQPDLMASIFESKGIGDFLSRAAAYFQVRNYGSHLLTSIKTEQQRLQQEDDRLRSDQAADVKKQKDLADAQTQLITAELKEAAILTALNSSIKDAQGELDKANSQTAALVAQIVAAQIAREDQLIQAANDAAWAAAQAWMASNNIVYPPPSGVHKYLLWPTSAGSITQGFGPTDYGPEPAGPHGEAHFHYGIDDANNSGTPIRAADDGVVVAAEDSVLNGHLIGYGRHVIISHRNGSLTLYGHLEGYFVKVGDKVTRGVVIGAMGSTGNSSGPHLHFEVRINNTPVDPTNYLPPGGPNDFDG